MYLKKKVYIFVCLKICCVFNRNDDPNVHLLIHEIKKLCAENGIGHFKVSKGHL